MTFRLVIRPFGRSAGGARLSEVVLMNVPLGSVADAKLKKESRVVRAPFASSAFVPCRLGMVVRIRHETNVDVRRGDDERAFIGARVRVRLAALRQAPGSSVCAESWRVESAPEMQHRHVEE